MIPGELFVDEGEIELNRGRATQSLSVANTGDRPIQVGSHYHFAETNAALAFDRGAARGFRLNIAAGTAVRFEPGQARRVELVALAGDRIVYGFTGAVMGPLDKRPAKNARRAKGTAGARKTSPKGKKTSPKGKKTSPKGKKTAPKATRTTAAQKTKAKAGVRR